MAAAGIDASNVGLGLGRAAAARPRRQRAAAARRAARAHRRQRRRGRHRHRRAGVARGPDRHRDRRRRTAWSPRTSAGARTPTATRRRSPCPPSPTRSPAPPSWRRASSAAVPSPWSAAGPTWCWPPATTAPAPARWSGPRVRTSSGTAPARPSSGRWRGTPRTGARSATPARSTSWSGRSGGSHRTGAIDRGGATRATPASYELALGGAADRTAVDRGVLRPRLAVDGWRAGDSERGGHRVTRHSVDSAPDPRRSAPHERPERSPVPDPRDTSAVAKKDRTDRQAVIDSIRKKQEGAEKRRGFAIVGGVRPGGAGRSSAPRPTSRSRTGGTCGRSTPRPSRRSAPPPRTAARSPPRRPPAARTTSSPAPRSQYEDSPPAFGQHYNVWDGIERKLYNESDRPDVGELVHNLEHGYTILWYDETVAGNDAMMDDLRGIASKKSSTTNLPQQVQGRAVDLRGRRALPLGPARRDDALVGRRRGRRRAAASRSACSSTAPPPAARRWTSS